MSSHPAGSEPRERLALRLGFATRLLLAQALVLTAGALTSWLVASGLGPGIFRQHLDQAGLTHTPSEAGHLDKAFNAALLVSVGLALLAATAVALAVTWYFTHRVQRSIAAVAGSASEIAAGHFGSRVPSPHLGGEFDMLADTFNELAHRLDEVETTRRRMLADLAHEMRTPLATIDAHLEAVEDGVRALDVPTLSVLRSSTQRLGRLAQDIGAVSRAEEGDVAIHPVSTSAVDLLRRAARAAVDAYRTKGVALTIEQPTDVVVDVDPERMGQMLGNLLDNALRHTPAGGTVSLSCRALGGWADFTVRDSGDGIPRDDVAHVFDRFYRVDAARNQAHGGSGIGLTITKALAEAHGGTVFVDSPGPGCGATFTVRLPQEPSRQGSSQR